MATYQAISTVSDTIVHLLESQYRPEDFGGHQLEFKVYLAKDFAKPIDAGVSVFLYRIYANGTHRTPAGRTDPTGRHHQTQLPLDLYYLLTAWAQDASLQHAIAGWMMRVLEDQPTFPPGLLNWRGQNVFRESVTLSLAELETETLFRIWEVIVQHAYQISVPYVARNVRIESGLFLSEGAVVQERVFDYREKPQ
jgi:hypothetical protein